MSNYVEFGKVPRQILPYFGHKLVKRRNTEVELLTKFCTALFFASILISSYFVAIELFERNAIARSSMTSLERSATNQLSGPLLFGLTPKLSKKSEPADRQWIHTNLTSKREN